MKTKPALKSDKKTVFKEKSTQPAYLLQPYQPKSGRSAGKVSIRHRAGGVKRKYRVVDFQQKPLGKSGKVIRIEYDPNRSAKIALIKYPTGQWSYILAADQLKVGDQVECGENPPLHPGNRLPLKNIPLGTEIYNIELTPGSGGQIVRAAGSRAAILAKDGNFIHLKLPSGEIRKVLGNCLASIGKVSNLEHSAARKYFKAGLLKYRGRRPKVRGKAMSPDDHPHGGGEGVNPIGLVHPKTPWGKPAIGFKTRKKKSSSDKMIVRRRK